MAYDVDDLTGISDPMLTRPFRIRRVKRDTYDTFTLELTPPEGSFRFLPGQFNMLYLFGVGESAISISGDPAKTDTLIHTIRAVGTVTTAMSKLKAGDQIGVRGPFGTSWPVEAAEGADLVIIAGGIGLAPLRPTIYHALRYRERYGKVILLYGARSPQDLLYTRELERWRASGRIEVGVTVDHAVKSWHGAVGVVTKLIQKARFASDHAVAMCCGPEVMMRFCSMELRARGVSETDIYLSMERNMKCAVGFCGHCQFGPTFVCKDGPVMTAEKVRDWFGRREL